MSEKPSLTVPEYAALAAIVVIWGVNNAAAKVATETMPPLLVGALRFVIAGVCLAPWLRPPFPEPKSLIPLVLFGGPLHFALVYTALALAHDLSPVAVALQLWIPFTAIAAWLVLGERPTPAVTVGLVVAFGGVAFMTADPGVLRDWPAILVAGFASAAWAMATVLARRTQAVRPIKMQALIAVVAAPTLGLGSALFEKDPLGAIARATPLVWGTILWAALVSTVVATGLLFWLVQRREAARVTPYLLTTPVVSILIGVLLMGDVLTPQILAGAAATIFGVGLVALAERHARNRRATNAASVPERPRRRPGRRTRRSAGSPDRRARRG
jgi:O-acetylserine/cysteine efflux transporter